MEVSVARSAYSDLEDIISYYNDQGVPDIGARFVGAILDHIQILSEYPCIGRVVPEFGVEHIREIIHPPFRVVYQREADAVIVIRVWRSERLLGINAVQEESAPYTQD